MPRAARVVAEGVPHHITQRGNNRQDVFLVDEDRRFYFETLPQDCRRCGVGVLGYCLMTNHVHLVAVPERADSFARALRRSHLRYAQRFNRQYGRSGHLWQNRFFSCPLGRDHLLTALFYVDQNPLRAGLVGQALRPTRRKGTPQGLSTGRCGVRYPENRDGAKPRRARRQRTTRNESVRQPMRECRWTTASLWPGWSKDSVAD